jgi:hypothetical protein
MPPIRSFICFLIPTLLVLLAVDSVGRPDGSRTTELLKKYFGSVESQR